MLAGALLLVLSQPSLAGTPAVAAPSPEPSASRRILATLTRTSGGWGQGAAYEVSIAPDGTVRYQGRANVGVLGARAKKLTPRELAEIVAAFDKARYFSLNDKYEGGPTDNRWTVTSFNHGGRTKTVRHYMAADAPAALSELEHRIDTIVGTRAWVYLSPEEEYRRQQEDVLKARAQSDVIRARLPALLAQLRDSNPDVRRRAAFDLLAARGYTYTDSGGGPLIGTSEMARIAPVLGEALVHPDRAVRKRAAIQLLAFGKEAGPMVPSLIVALAYSDPQVRAEAAGQLSRIGPPAAVAAIPALERALHDRDPTVRYTAARVLPELGYSRDRVIEMLIAGLRSADEGDRVASATALMGQGRPGRVAIPALREALRDASPTVRDAARKALADIESER